MNQLPIGRDKLPILIVGAGPTGLMMASQLARFKIFQRLIETSVPRTKSAFANV